LLPEAQLRYRTYGKLNDSKDNVLVVCHALTGNASLHAWWGGLLGNNKAFDTSKYLVVCCNILGSCYGSTSPRSVDPTTGSVYGKAFPDVSVKDTVKLQLHLLKEQLGISSIKAVIGGSFGGMQAMEFAVQAGSSCAEFLTLDGKFESTWLGERTLSARLFRNVLTEKTVNCAVFILIIRITLRQVCCSNCLWGVTHCLADCYFRGPATGNICRSKLGKRCFPGHKGIGGSSTNGDGELPHASGIPWEVWS
jgi:pimeloyl-ACP methyl ester carboxylesterase